MSTRLSQLGPGISVVKLEPSEVARTLSEYEEDFSHEEEEEDYSHQEELHQPGGVVIEADGIKTEILDEPEPEEEMSYDFEAVAEGEEEEDPLAL